MGPGQQSATFPFLFITRQFRPKLDTTQPELLELAPESALDLANFMNDVTLTLCAIQGRAPRRKQSRSGGKNVKA